MPTRDNGPRVMPPRASTGRSYGSATRDTAWSEARRIRSQLKPVETQQAVASQLCISRQAVEQIELRALAKVAHAFRGMKGQKI